MHTWVHHICLASDTAASASLKGDAEERLSANASDAQQVMASSLDRVRVMVEAREVAQAERRCSRAAACSAIKLLHHVLPVCLGTLRVIKRTNPKQAYMLCEMLCISNRCFRAQNIAASHRLHDPLGSRSGRLWAIKCEVTEVSEYSSSALYKHCKGRSTSLLMPVRPWDIACKPHFTQPSLAFLVRAGEPFWPPAALQMHFSRSLSQSPIRTSWRVTPKEEGRFLGHL